MSTALAPPERPGSDRVIGHFHGDRPGPTLVIVGSLHGNEPAGCEALTRVVAELEDGGHLTCGDFLALVGNITAKRANERFIERDLNRQWSREQVNALSDRTDLDAEGLEQRDLSDELLQAFARARGPIYLLDLHTTSGPGKPFAVFPDTLRSRRFARRFPVPAVLGLEEKLVGTLVDFVSQLGHAAMGVEGGQHQEPASVERLQSVAWIGLAELGLVDGRASERASAARGELRSASAGLPGFLEVTYRHGVTASDGFRMLPGFAGFQSVRAGQAVAQDRDGDVRVLQDGYLLMPLYQRQGDDGFFVIRKVWRGWMILSGLLRRLRFGRFVHWLPGVERVEADPHRFRVDRRIAKWYALELLHLLGFRRQSEDGDVLVMARRPHDLT